MTLGNMEKIAPFFWVEHDNSVSVCPDLTEKVAFDSEGSLFCAYSKDSGALEEFICIFKSICEDNTKILDLFSRAELD